VVGFYRGVENGKRTAAVGYVSGLGLCGRGIILGFCVCHFEGNVDLVVEGVLLF